MAIGLANIFLQKAKTFARAISPAFGLTEGIMKFLRRRKPKPPPTPEPGIAPRPTLSQAFTGALRATSLPVVPTIPELIEKFPTQVKAVKAFVSAARKREVEFSAEIKKKGLKSIVPLAVESVKGFIRGGAKILGGTAIHIFEASKLGEGASLGERMIEANKRARVFSDSVDKLIPPKGAIGTFVGTIPDAAWMGAAGVIGERKLGVTTRAGAFMVNAIGDAATAYLTGASAKESAWTGGLGGVFGAIFRPSKIPKRIIEFEQVVRESTLGVEGKAILTGKYEEYLNWQQMGGEIRRLSKEEAEVVLLAKRTVPETKDPIVFTKAVEKVPRKYGLEEITPKEYSKMKLFLNPEGYGSAIKKDGTIMSLFNTSGKPGRGELALFTAIENGGKKLDAFEGFLTKKYYKKFGFEETGRVKFDDELAPKGWDVDIQGRPDIISMELNPEKYAVYKRTASERGGVLERGVRIDERGDRGIEEVVRKRKRGLAKSIERKAIEDKVVKSFEGLPEYEAKPGFIKDQAARAAKIFKEDKELAIKIAMGEKLPPGGVLPESLLIHVREVATVTRDIDLLIRLGTKSGLLSEATTMGQRMRMLGEINPDSAIATIQKVAKRRIESFEKKTGTTAVAARKKIKSDIKKQMRKGMPTKADWNSFIDSITC